MDFLAAVMPATPQWDGSSLELGEILVWFFADKIKEPLVNFVPTVPLSMATMKNMLMKASCPFTPLIAQVCKLVQRQRLTEDKIAQALLIKLKQKGIGKVHYATTRKVIVAESVKLKRVLAAGITIAHGVHLRICLMHTWLL